MRSLFPAGFSENFDGLIYDIRIRRLLISTNIRDMLKTLIRSWILLGYIPTKRGQFNQLSTLYRQGTELRFLSRAPSCFPTDRLKKRSVALAPMPPCFYIQPHTTRTPVKCCSRRLFLLITVPTGARKLRKLRRDSLVHLRQSVLKIHRVIYRKLTSE